MKADARAREKRWCCGCERPLAGRPNKTQCRKGCSGARRSRARRRGLTWDGYQLCRIPPPERPQLPGDRFGWTPQPETRT